MVIKVKKSASTPNSEIELNALTTAIVPLNLGSKVLLPHHLEELLASGIDREIINLNFFSINGDAVVQLLNLASLPGFGFKYGSVIYAGGWVCGSILKPHKPRTIKQKTVKYENPIGSKTTPIKLKLPESIWQAIARKYGVSKDASEDGWTWVENHPQIPVVVCEGVKTAGCVISQTLTPAIALGGHTLAFEKNGDIRFPEFLHPDREIKLCFDNDVSDTVASALATTIKGIGFRINPKINNKVSPRARLSICTSRYPEKGIDDVWLKHGGGAVDLILNSTVPWKQWVDTSHSKLGVVPDVIFNSPKWQTCEIPTDNHLIALIGAKGTGKSWFLEQLAQLAKAQNLPIIALTHRIQLSSVLAERLGLTYIDNLEEKNSDAVNIALVIDSLAKINTKKFKGAYVFIDEVVQTLEHFMIGETCAFKRQTILESLKNLAKIIIENGGKFVIADADLNGTTLRFFSGLLGDETPYLIQNTYCEPSYKCWLSNGFIATTPRGRAIKCPADILSTVIAKALNGERIFICCTGQKEESKWGSITIEALLLRFGIKSVIRIDSDTIKDPSHLAFKAANKINEICDNYQIIIATPTLGTGVSIENQKKFDLVCGIFTGVGSPDGARQFLMRLRDKSVERLIYCADRGLDTRLLNLGYNNYKVAENIKELAEFQQSILAEHDKDWSEEYPEIRHCNTASMYFNNLIAAKNSQTTNFKNYVRQGLKDEDVEVVDILDASKIFDCGAINPQEIYELSGELSLEHVTQYREQIAAQERVEAEEYERLKAATELSTSERLSLEATALSNKYGGITLTPEIVENDSNGWYEQIRLHYATTVGYEHLKNIQALISNTQLRRGEGEVIEHDFVARNKILAQAEFIQATEILDLIESEHTFSAADETSLGLYEDMVQQIPNINLICEQNIKATQFKSGEFNFKLIAIIGSLLDAESHFDSKRKINGKAIRHYKLTFPEDTRNEIFALWKERDINIEQKWFKRKREWEIKQLIGQLNANISLSDFERLKQLELFNDAWERVYTDERIQIINRADAFKLPKNEKVMVDGIDSVSVKEAFQVINNWDIVSLDCETFGNDTKNKDGLHKFKAQLRLMQLSNGQKTYTFDFGERKAESRKHAIATVQPLLQKLLSNKHKTVVGQNLGFDLGILSSNFKLKIDCKISDTLLGIQIFTGVYNGRNAWEGGFGLKALAKKLLGLDIDKTEQKSDWGAALTKSQIDYAADDPHTTYWVWRRLLELYQNPVKFGFSKLAKWDMMDAWELECACLVPLAEMEQTGLPIDLPTLYNLNKQVQLGLTETLAKWEALATGVSKPSQVQKLIEHLNTKYNLTLTKADKKTLSDYKEYPEVALRFTHSGLLQYQARLKKLIRSAEQNDRAKVFYSVLSGTGRTSSGGKFDDIVNIQSIPAKVDDSLKDLNLPSIRSAFKPKEGKALIVSDLAASHARIACDFAQDKLGMEVQNNDVDAHSLFAIKIAQCIPEQIRTKNLPDKFLAVTVSIADVELLGEFKNSGKTHPICKQLRDVSKNIYYGKLNGASWKRIQAEARGQLKVQISESEAKAISAVFEELYPQLTAYCKSVAIRLEDESNQMWLDGKLFGVSAIAETNQRLLFWLKQTDEKVEVPYTNCVASQWSRTEATAMKKALVLCFKLFRKHPEWGAKVVNIVHDELNVECDERYAAKVSKVVAWAMSRYFQLELKNGVHHGCVDFKNNHTEKYLKDVNGDIKQDKKGKPINDPKFATSIYSMIVSSWADK